MTPVLDSHKTLVDGLKLAFEMTLRSPEGIAAPAALLWTDAEKEWLPLIPILKSAIPQLYVLGEYDPESKTGPVIWLKCIVDRTLKEVAPDADLTPILYLPGIDRQVLRAGADCPVSFQPLVELQYRGAVWHQRDGRDWTVSAFLSTEAGLGLDIAQDMRTKEAMLRALPLLAGEPMSGLRGRRLEAEDFDRLAVGDPIRDLLSWLASPEVFQERCEPARWKTFREVCKREFDLDPDNGPSVAGDALLHGDGRWEDVWRRFCEAPQLYRGVISVLRDAKPKDLYVDEEKIPAKNEESEERLRKALKETLEMAQPQACDAIARLESEHQKRRQWVWAQLGESPLCVVLEFLAKLAGLVKSPLGGISIKQMTDAYADKGWWCDKAVLETLSTMKNSSDSDLIKDVVRLLYEPWLDQTARHFQKLVLEDPSAISSLINPVPGDKETCVLFVDGLRFDLGAVLLEKLEHRGLKARLSHKIAPSPTVTSTAKPVAASLQAYCQGKDQNEDFYPAMINNDQLATTPRLRDALQKNRTPVLDSAESSYGKGGEAGAWTESGELDTLGHKVGSRMVQHFDMELDLVVERVQSLLDGGWSHVRIVTDHGWILVPGGLKKIELPSSLVGTKWARCAMVKGETTPSVPVFPWFWNPQVLVASPPGAGSFIAGTEYAHGGVSLQECVIPEIIVERGVSVSRAKIGDIKWLRLICRVGVGGNIKGVRVDLRQNWKQANTSVATPKELTGTTISVTVEDEKLEGTAVAVVLLDESGRILDHKPTTIGANL